MSNLSSFYPQPVIAGTTAGTFAEGNAPRIIDVTHAELLSLMGAQNLKRGFHYRITDFVTEYMSNDQEWISPSNTANVSNNNGTAFTVASIAATPEPLIVYAFSSSEVSKQAYSELHPSDIIHYNPELTYLDGTRTAKGFIIYRKDTVKNLECPFDWRNVKFKRWAIDPTAGDNPIPLLQGNTAYKVGDLVYTTSPAAIFICKKNHTSASTPSTAGNFQSISLYSGNARIFSPDMGIPSYVGAGNINKAGFRGGVGQAAYYSVFSNFNGSLAGSNFGNISISSIGSFTISNSNSYSLGIPNVVLLNSALNTSGHYNIKIENSSRITICGLGGKNQINILSSSGLYLDGTYTDVSISNSLNLHIGQFALFQSTFYDCSNTYIIGSSGRKDLSYKHASNVTATSAYDMGVNNCRNLVNSENVNTSYTNISFQFNGHPIRFVARKNTSVISPAHVFPAINNLPVMSYVDENGQNAIEKIYSDEELLHVQLNNGVLDAIDGIANPAASLPIFSVIDNSTPTYTRNTSCWINDYVNEITCVSPWNSAYGNLFGCTAITPRHVLFAKHVTTPLTGATIRFVTEDNQVVSRTIVRTVTESTTGSNFDSGIALLDSNLPETIHKAKIIPVGLAEYLPYDTNASIWFPSSGMFYVDQQKKAIIVDWRAYFGGVDDGGAVNFIRPLSSATPDFFNATNDSNKHEFYEPVVTNDSGGPVFSILNNELVLMGAITLGASPAPVEGDVAGVFYTKSNVYNTLISQVDAAQGISTGYTITLADISSFTKVN